MVTEIWRTHANLTESTIAYSSYVDRLNDTSLRFFKAVLDKCIKSTATGMSLKLRERYEKLVTVYSQDSTIVRLNKKLADQFPATRSMRPWNSNAFVGRLNRFSMKRKTNVRSETSGYKRWSGPYPAICRTYSSDVNETCVSGDETTDEWAWGEETLAESLLLSIYWADGSGADGYFGWMERIWEAELRHEMFTVVVHPT